MPFQAFILFKCNGFLVSVKGMRRIQSKLLAGFVCIVAIVGLQAFVGYVSSLQVEKLLDQAYRASAAEISAGEQMRQAATGIRMVLSEPGNLDVPTTRAEVDELLRILERSIGEGQVATGVSLEVNRQLNARSRELEEEQDLESLDEVKKGYLQLLEEWKNLKGGTFSAELVGPMRRILDKEMLPAVLGYQNSSIRNIADEGSQAAKVIRDSRVMLAITAATSLLAAMIAGLLLARSVIGPLRQMTREANAISKGDFGRRLSSGREDEFGQLGDSFNHVLDALQAVSVTREDLETRISERTAELDRFFTLSLDMLCIADFSGKFLRVNRAFVDTLGYPLEEYLTKPFSSFIHPDDQRATETEMEKYRSTGEASLHFENRYRHRDGTWRTLSWNAVPLPEVRLIYGVAHDITELRRIEQTLRTREEELRLALSAQRQAREMERLRASRMLEYQQSLLRLRDLKRSELDVFIHETTEECARLLDVERVSVWFLNVEGTELECRDLFEKSRQAHSMGIKLSREAYPAYFRAISGLAPVVADDAVAHASTCEFADNYLRPQGIMSMLDIPIRAGENLVGVLCCEQTGSVRKWVGEEIEFASGVASALMLGVEQGERAAAEEKLRRLNATLEERIDLRTAELRASEERFRLMIEQVQDYAIFLLSADGIVSTWNVGVERATGYTAEEIIGRHFSCFHSPEEIREGVPDQLLNDAMSQNVARQEGWRVRKDGSRFWAECVITAIRDDKGVLRGFAKVTHDLTERRSAEVALTQALETQRDLTRKAQAGEKARSEFLAIMSHEVRTPMNGIIGYADLLASSRELGGDNRHYVDILLQSGQALLRILDDILDFSGLEAGSLKIEYESFSPRQMIEDVRLLLSPVATRKGIDLKTEVMTDVPEILVSDAGRLRQVLINLGGNAIKFTDSGSVTIRLEGAGEGNPGLWDLSVADTGPGLTREQQERIFQPFVQGDASSSRRHGGTGLGLAISRRLVELMKGSISVVSRVNEGSRFTARLPMSAGKKKRRELDPAQLHHGADFAVRHPLKILVAEDDTINLKLILTLLGKLGYDAISAKNGREAVEQFIRQTPTCILMDLQMPEMDGVEATMAIREMERSCGQRPVHIVALTANTDEGDRRRCFDAGMSTHANKPIRREQLCELLATASRDVQNGFG